MKAVILAAGVGYRLKMALPKALAMVTNGKTILDYQVEKLAKYVSASNICVVVGYKKETIMETHPEVTYIVNEEYAECNTGKSLLKALNRIESDDVLWLNGDVIFDERLIPRLITAKSSCVLVDNKKCGAEEVKYNSDSNGFIMGISKEVVSAEGEALGINVVRRRELEIFKKHLTLVDRQDYFEKAIENMIRQDGVKILPVNTDGLFCHEIDFLEDLENVRQYLSEAYRI